MSGSKINRNNIGRVKAGGLGDVLSNKWKHNISVHLSFDKYLNVLLLQESLLS